MPQTEKAEENIVRVSLTLEQELSRLISKMADKEDRSWSSMARVLLKKGIEQKLKQPA